MGFSALSSNNQTEKNLFYLTFRIFTGYFYRYRSSFFKWHGPISGLFGLITWYLRPTDNGAITGLTGLLTMQIIQAHG